MRRLQCFEAAGSGFLPDICRERLRDRHRSQDQERRKQLPADFRSTLLIGASSLANVAFGIIRSKAMALLLGPAGIGLIGLYNALAELCQTAAGLGVQASGVRQIADSAGADDNERVRRTVATLRFLSLLLGVAGLH